MLNRCWKGRVIQGAYYISIGIAWLPFILPVAYSAERCAVQYLYGTLLDLLGDDAAQIAQLSFSFPLYCQEHSVVGISTNGLLTFGESSTSYSNAPIPTATIARPFIAPFWTDLMLQNKGIYMYASSDRFMVQWTNIGFYGTNICAMEAHNETSNKWRE